jgi:hypothetical protein
LSSYLQTTEEGCPSAKPPLFRSMPPILSAEAKLFGKMGFGQDAMAMG